MPRRVILYFDELPGCTRLSKLLGQEFECTIVETEAEFLEKLQQAEVEAALLCFCSAREPSVDILLRLVALAGPIPVLTCSRTYSPSFIQLAASRGVTNFLLCEIEAEKFRNFVLRTIRVNGLRGFLDSYWAGLDFSPHVAKLVKEIVQAFPRRLTTSDVSRRLGITARRLQAICQETFGRSFSHLLRLIWVRQALTLMWNTRLDNTEIALRLGYQDESSLARIFRRELGYGPTEARHRLAKLSPDELLKETRRSA